MCIVIHVITPWPGRILDSDDSGWRGVDYFSITCTAMTCRNISSLITGLKMNTLNETLITVNLDRSRTGLLLESFPVAMTLLRSSLFTGVIR